VPVLARLIEAEGIPTVTVTMMPDVAEWLLAPRIVGVEFPYGHTFGPVGDEATHRRVLATALSVLAGAGSFGTRVDVDIAWPTPRGEAYKSWQPAEASPIVKLLLGKG
jgi:D-proline reductase (dithiol) PrdB